MAGRDDLQKLIDELPDVYLAEIIDFAKHVAQRAREANIAAVKAAFDALPEDDEELNEETWARIHAAERDPERISMEEIKAELGL